MKDKLMAFSGHLFAVAVSVAVLVAVSFLAERSQVPYAVDGN